MRHFTEEEQIAAIDNAVSEGWHITQVTVDTAIGPVVHFAKDVAAQPSPFSSNVFPGLETSRRELGCGLVAMEYARKLMEQKSR